MLSRTIEAVEINNKTLFYEFHVEYIEFTLSGQTIKTNKWLRFEEWEQIYEELKKITIARSKTRNKSPEESFTIGNYIKVKVKRIPIKSYYYDLFEVESKKCAAKIFQVNIKQISPKHEEYDSSETNGNSSFEEATELNCQPTQTPELNENSSAQSVCDLITPDKPDDVEPNRCLRKRKTSKSPKSTAIQDESPVCSSQAKRHRLSEDLFPDSQEFENNEFEAETTEDKPTASNGCKKKSSSRHKKSKVATPENGMSQSEPEFEERTPENSNTEPIRRTKRASAQKITNYNYINTNRPHKSDLNVSKQPTQDRAPKSVKRTFLAKPKSKLKKAVKVKRKHRADNLTPPSSQDSESSKQFQERLLRTPTKEELQQNKEINEKRLETYSAFSKNLQDLLKPPPDVEIVTLNSMKTQDLIATFDEFKSQLDEFFETYKEQKRFHFVSDNETLHILTLNIIERKQVISMMNHLMTVYEPICDGVPTYTDIFTNVMAPEWILLIFMKQYNLTRQDAIERIKVQRDIEAFNQTQTLGE